MSCTCVESPVFRVRVNLASDFRNFQSKSIKIKQITKIRFFEIANYMSHIFWYFMIIWEGKISQAKVLKYTQSIKVQLRHQNIKIHLTDFARSKYQNATRSKISKSNLYFNTLDIFWYFGARRNQSKSTNIFTRKSEASGPISGRKRWRRSRSDFQRIFFITQHFHAKYSLQWRFQSRSMKYRRGCDGANFK